MAEDLDEDFDDDADFDSGDFDDDGGGKKKLLLMVVAPLLLVIGGAAAAYFTGLADPLLSALGGGGDEPAVEASAEAGAGGAGEGAEGDSPTIAPSSIGNAVFYDMPEIVSDISSSGRRRSFIKLRITLELDSAEDIALIETVLPRVNNEFLTFVRTLRPEDLQGSVGIYSLQEELLRRVNDAIRPRRVNEVLIQEMTLQ